MGCDHLGTDMAKLINISRPQKTGFRPTGRMEFLEGKDKQHSGPQDGSPCDYSPSQVPQAQVRPA